jgi:hypothetical protein
LLVGQPLYVDPPTRLLLSRRRKDQRIHKRHKRVCSSHRRRLLVVTRVVAGDCFSGRRSAKDMAAEQNGAQIRPPPGPFPSPRSYTSPQMQPSYAYPPPQGQPGDAFRHSPATSNASLPPVSLPPLRSIDGQQPPPPPQLMPQAGHQQLQQGMPPMHGYYTHPSHGMPHPGRAMPPYARYAPIPHGTAMPGGRGKKEIKRRTKTGCLTCRKRRIKVSSSNILYSG